MAGPMKCCPGGARHIFCRFLAAAQNLAGGDQREGEHEAKRHACARTEPALFDRVANEQKATEGQRDTADIDRPVRAKRLFETARWRLREKLRRFNRLGLLLPRRRVFGLADGIICPSGLPLPLRLDLFGLRGLR